MYEFDRTARIEANLALLAGVRDRVSQSGPARSPSLVLPAPPDGISQDRSWRLEQILAIHRRFLRPDQPGREGFRTSTWPLLDEATFEPVYHPPPEDEVRALTAELADWAHDWVRGRHPELGAPLVAALIHVRLAGIHPFHDANGRTARTLATLAMLHGGYDSPEFTTLDHWWELHRSEYLRSFRCLGPRWDANRDVTSFVEEHIAAQHVYARACLCRRLVERRLAELLGALAFARGLEPRTVLAMEAVLKANEVSNRSYRAGAGVSVATASNDLAAMEKAGFLAASGAGRSRVYVRGPRLLPMLRAEAGLGSISPTRDPNCDETFSLILAAIYEALRAEGELPEASESA